MPGLLGKKIGMTSVFSVLVPTYIKPEDANIKEIATTREK